MNDGSEFGGLKEFAEKEKAAAASAAPAAAVPAVEPAAPAAPAASEPAKAPAVAAPAAPKTGETPAAAAARKSWKVTGKVAGADKAWEIDEDHFDEKNEKSKWLRDQLQKADDYDRPGGALDSRAAKIAREQYNKDMVEQGFWVKTPDGRFAESPAVQQYRAWREAQAKAASAPPPAAPAPPSAPVEPTPRQKRIAELTKKGDAGEGLSGPEYRELARLDNEDLLDERDAKKAAEAAKQEADRAAAAQATAARAAQTTAEQKASADRDAEARAEIQRHVGTLGDKLRDPVTGKVEDYDAKACFDVIAISLLETRDWAKALAAGTEYAERHSARLKSMVDKLPKQATDAPPPPVHPAGRPASGGEDKKEGFNPEDPFPAGGLSKFAARRAG